MLLHMNGLRMHITAEKDATNKDWDAVEEMPLGILEMYSILKRMSGQPSLTTPCSRHAK
jgi:hypothetical protein